MKLTDMLSLTVQIVEDGTTELAHYWIADTGDSKFVSVITLKIEHGVLFQTAEWSHRPTLENLIHRCQQEGAKSSRPYRLGQGWDTASTSCVFALFLDCCLRNHLNPQKIHEEALFPVVPRIGWTSSEIKELKALTEWEGILIPAEWTGHEEKNLLETLLDMHESALAKTLLQSLMALRVPREKTVH